MDKRTGEIKLMKEVEKLPEEERRNFIPVPEKVSQGWNRNKKRVRLNEPCGCGSNKKFKNCCYAGAKKGEHDVNE